MAQLKADVVQSASMGRGRERGLRFGRGLGQRVGLGLTWR